MLSGRPCDLLPNKTLSCIWVAKPVDWIIYIGMPVVRTVVRSLAWCTVTWLPNFLGSVDYHISLANGLRAARGAPPWTCQVLFRKKNAITCILARNTWASVSVIYYPSIKCKYNTLFFSKNLWWLFFIYMSEKKSLYMHAREPRMIVNLLLTLTNACTFLPSLWYFNLWSLASHAFASQASL